MANVNLFGSTAPNVGPIDAAVNHFAPAMARGNPFGPMAAANPFNPAAAAIGSGLDVAANAARVFTTENSFGTVPPSHDRHRCHAINHAEPHVDRDAPPFISTNQLDYGDPVIDRRQNHHDPQQQVALRDINRLPSAFETLNQADSHVGPPISENEQLGLLIQIASRALRDHSQLQDDDLASTSLHSGNASGKQ